MVISFAMIVDKSSKTGYKFVRANSISLEGMLKVLNLCYIAFILYSQVTIANITCIFFSKVCCVHILISANESYGLFDTHKFIVVVVQCAVFLEDAMCKSLSLYASLSNYECTGY